MCNRCFSIGVSRGDSVKRKCILLKLNTKQKQISDRIFEIHRKNGTLLVLIIMRSMTRIFLAEELVCLVQLAMPVRDIYWKHMVNVTYLITHWCGDRCALKLHSFRKREKGASFMRVFMMISPIPRDTISIFS